MTTPNTAALTSQTIVTQPAVHVHVGKITCAHPLFEAGSTLQELSIHGVCVRALGLPCGLTV